MIRAVCAAAAMLAGALTLAAPAGASGPQVNSACLSLQINRTTTAGTGETVRCLVNDQGSYVWTVDTGRTQDPWISDQVEASACRAQGRPDDECRSPVAVAIPLKDNTPGYTFVETDTFACVISQPWVNCMGDFTNPPSQDAYTVQVTRDGDMSWLGGNIGELSGKVTLDRRFYSAQGWIVSTDASGTTFVNVVTGHGMFVSLDNIYGF